VAAGFPAVSAGLAGVAEVVVGPGFLVFVAGLAFG
jgi:hypothetical protein